MSNSGLICECGFKFAGAGEFRNCGAFVTQNGESGVVCPRCNNAYVNGQFVGKYEPAPPEGDKNEQQ
jgi:hypothetical protein